MVTRSILNSLSEFISNPRLLLTLALALPSLATLQALGFISATPIKLVTLMVLVLLFIAFAASIVILIGMGIFRLTQLEVIQKALERLLS